MSLFNGAVLFYFTCLTGRHLEKRRYKYWPSVLALLTNKLKGCATFRLDLVLQLYIFLLQQLCLLSPLYSDLEDKLAGKLMHVACQNCYTDCNELFTSLVSICAGYLFPTKYTYTYLLSYEDKAKNT